MFGSFVFLPGGKFVKQRQICFIISILQFDIFNGII